MTSRGGPELAARYIGKGEGHYVIYRVERSHSFLLTGNGNVAGVDLNRIELTDLVPSEGAVVLSLHWLETWRTDPPLPVEPVLDSPRPGSDGPDLDVSAPQAAFTVQRLWPVTRVSAVYCRLEARDRPACQLRRTPSDCVGKCCGDRDPDFSDGKETAGAC